MRWYISIAATKQYARLAGLTVESDGPSFDRAETELAALCDAAVLKKEDGHLQTWLVRGRLRPDGPRSRIELTVSTAARPEGPLPQLIHVRRKS